MIKQKIIITEGEIYGFKLGTGEEVLARLRVKERSEYIVESPYVLMIVDNGVALVAWPITAEENTPIGIPLSHILAVFQPQDKYIEYYQEETSSFVLSSAETLN